MEHKAVKSYGIDLYVRQLAKEYVIKTLTLPNTIVYAENPH